MPKMKTHKGIARRFRKTASGKLKYKTCGAGHLMSTKTGDRCRRMRKPATLHDAIARLYLLRIG